MDSVRTRALGRADLDSPDAVGRLTLLLSASQITTYRDCQRKWALRSLARIVPPQAIWGALGDKVDAQLQRYLTTGEAFDYSATAERSGYIAASGLQYLPQPKHPGLEVQKRFVIPSPHGITARGQEAAFGYQGYQDLWLPLGGLPNTPNPIVPATGDFKTLKDFKWAKTEDELRVDVQAMLYATWAVFSTRSKVVDLAWLYLRTDPRQAYKSQCTRTRVDADHVATQFLEIDATGAEMVAHRAACTGDPIEYALTLTPNPLACDSYGGCPYRGQQCHLSPALMAESLASIDVPRRLPVLNANNPDPVNPKEALVNAPSSASSTLARLKAGRAAALGQTPPTAPAPPPPPPPPAQLPAWATAPIDPRFPPPAPVGINPPEVNLPPAPPVGAAAPATASPRRTRATKAEMEARRAAAAAVVAAAPAIEAPASEAPVADMPTEFEDGSQPGNLADALEDLAEAIFHVSKCVRSSAA